MLKPRDRQVGFYDADYVCEQLVPNDSFYRKFREIVDPLIEDEQFETMSGIEGSDRNIQQGGK